jgi:hypothetical protein
MGELFSLERVARGGVNKFFLESIALFFFALRHFRLSFDQRRRLASPPLLFLLLERTMFRKRVGDYYLGRTLGEVSGVEREHENKRNSFFPL